MIADGHVVAAVGVHLLVVETTLDVAGVESRGDLADQSFQAGQVALHPVQTQS